MISTVKNWAHARFPSFLGASGVFSQGGGAMLEEGPGMIIVGVCLGAFVGLICGLIVANFVRFFALLSGRYMGTAVWTIICMVLGALVCGWLAAMDKGE
jgi:hypothetical protein